MTLPLASASIEIYRVGLLRLHGFIDRTIEHLSRKDGEQASLLRRSLAKQLFPLGKQIVAACFHAERDLARAAGLEVPPRSSPPMTLSDLRKRVERAIAYVDSIAPESIDDGITVVYGRAARTLSAVDYIRHYSIPHFHFHLSVVYVTLRMCGVPLGKSDFVREVEHGALALAMRGRPELARLGA